MKDEFYMKRALELSLLGAPSPNPYVGAVVVKEGKIISEGYHRKCGMAHAEVEALKGVDAEDATLYVTLEPCSHHGKTPPCTDSIANAGVKKVVYGADDPTDKVDGKKALLDAGVEVVSGMLKDECMRVNEVFFKHSLTGMPFVALKAAMSLDSQIATKKGVSKWITGDDSRKAVHSIRSLYDCIMVGVGTVLADDPQLDCRKEGGRDPVKVVLDSNLRTPDDARILEKGKTIIFCSESAKSRRKKALGEKADVIEAGATRPCLETVFKKLAELGYTSVLVEGGAQVNQSLLRSGLIDKYHLFYAPIIMGGLNTPAFSGDGIDYLEGASPLAIDEVERFGEDLLITAYPKR